MYKTIFEPHRACSDPVGEAGVPSSPSSSGRRPAATVVAVHLSGGSLSFAWSGDARIYFLLDGFRGPLLLLSEDHDERRACDGHGDRNLITACPGGIRDDKETGRLWGHLAIESMSGAARLRGLLLASDGAYEPHEDANHNLDGYLSR
ncbi:hypothetical protein ACFQ8W_03220 [Streptomyces sp. NPDC056508]|uniref:hypothetical protein n=1 Tax=Streptomyces sp. NPDC056508 TaxID=3345845 RepID=UPI0036C8BDC8